MCSVMMVNIFAMCYGGSEYFSSTYSPTDVDAFGEDLTVGDLSPRSSIYADATGIIFELDEPIPVSAGADFFVKFTCFSDAVTINVTFTWFVSGTHYIEWQGIGEYFVNEELFITTFALENESVFEFWVFVEDSMFQSYEYMWIIDVDRYPPRVELLEFSSLAFDGYESLEIKYVVNDTNFWEVVVFVGETLFRSYYNLEDTIVIPYDMFDLDGEVSKEFVIRLAFSDTSGNTHV